MGYAFTLLQLYAQASEDAGIPDWAKGWVAIIGSLVTLVGAIGAFVLSVVTAKRTRDTAAAIGKPPPGEPPVAVQVTESRHVGEATLDIAAHNAEHAAAIRAVVDETLHRDADRHPEQGPA